MRARCDSFRSHRVLACFEAGDLALGVRPCKTSKEAPTNTNIKSRRMGRGRSKMEGSSHGSLDTLMPKVVLLRPAMRSGSFGKTLDDARCADRLAVVSRPPVKSAQATGTPFYIGDSPLLA